MRERKNEFETTWFEGSLVLPVKKRIDQDLGTAL